MGLKIVLVICLLGCFFVPCTFGKSFADVIRGLPSKFEESEQSRALAWSSLKQSTPRGLLPFYMIAEYIIDSYSGGGLRQKFQALQQSCSVRALGVLIIPVLLAIVVAVAIIVLQVVNIILTALVLATNFGLRLTGKQNFGLFRVANETTEEYEQCNSQLLRLIRHDCAYQARDLTMVPLGEKEYYFSHSSIKLRWDDAQNFCRSRCQQLVSVEDPIEEGELFSHLMTMADDGGEIEPFWTSGSYKNGKYKWLATGRDFGYINLAPPRMHTRGRQVDSSCVGMATVKNETAWIGAPCEQMSRFICEKPLQLAYRDHFLYEQMRKEEIEEESAVETTTAAPESSTIPVPSAIEEKFNEIRRRFTEIRKRQG
ncbi:uncharacterized protein LOC132202697 [Neocloeon triangulifer]|uniref:uncharacterized protein LOC132202697 n=1 Tax=Neocloeon triangulifer TaxID=2078957 RepID=UPI00286F60F0|nr:uncharacterized protein LOC132202697 [Neocloeon triangulifer]